MWKSKIINQLNVTGNTFTTDQVTKPIDEQNFHIEKYKFLFNHKTTNREDSYILEYWELKEKNEHR